MDMNTDILKYKYGGALLHPVKVCGGSNCPVLAVLVSPPPCQVRPRLRTDEAQILSSSVLAAGDLDSALRRGGGTRLQ